MALTTDQWNAMNADERKAFKAAQTAKAVEAVEKGKFPTGLKVVIGGKEFLARPVRQTDSGGVTYSISPRPTSVGRYSARLNKLSLTLMGEGTSEATFEEEDIL